jgi:hypothetical protein
MLTGVLIGVGIMMAYVAIGFAAERHIRKLGQRLTREGSTDAGKIFNEPDLG